MTASPEAQLRGHCLCQSVGWEAAGPPLWTCYCHCESCRRNCAAPVTAFLGIADGTWRWTGAVPATYASSPGVTRHFCPRCGTPIAFEATRFPGEIHFHAASLTDQTAFRPENHVNHDERVPWMQIADDLPRHGAFSDDGGAT
ncbi:MAG: GFA family protein [Pseudomonadota bacterium]